MQLVPGNRQVFDVMDSSHGLVLDEIDGESQSGKSRGQGRKDLLALDAGEILAEAEVDTPAE